MVNLSNSPTSHKLDVTVVSTGIDPTGWRAWWREQSVRDGTDWVSLAWQHIGALSAVRAFCESNGASS
jgi:hypothetical protein